MYHLIKRLAVNILAVSAVIKTFSVLPSNDTSSRTYRDFSPTDANQATNTSNDDRQKNYRSPETDSTTKKANALLDLLHHLLRHDDATPMDATKIDAVNNAGT
jgi:hypothetical protein